MHAGRPIQISRKSVSNCRCSHCGTTYEVVWHTPAKDNGSAECDICGEELMRWSNSAIPSFRRKDLD
jgi:rRNA maturation endonuclease Nob1